MRDVWIIFKPLLAWNGDVKILLFMRLNKDVPAILILIEKFSDFLEIGLL